MLSDDTREDPSLKNGTQPFLVTPLIRGSQQKRVADHHGLGTDAIDSRHS